MNCISLIWPSSPNREKLRRENITSFVSIKIQNLASQVSRRWQHYTMQSLIIINSTNYFLLIGTISITNKILLNKPKCKLQGIMSCFLEKWFIAGKLIRAVSQVKRQGVWQHITSQNIFLIFIKEIFSSDF